MKKIELFWLVPGKSNVHRYVPGAEDSGNAPHLNSLVFERRVEAAALAALSECLGFLSKSLDVKRLWVDMGEDPAYWIKAVANADGDPLPVIEAWLKEQLPKAIAEWQQEQRERVMSALADLKSGAA